MKLLILAAIILPSLAALALAWAARSHDVSDHVHPPRYVCAVCEWDAIDVRRSRDG